MQPLTRILSLCVVLAGGAVGQHRGDLPAALVWGKLKGNCPVSLSWPSLRGKVVVISFGNSVAFPDEIAEWNSVIQRFEGDPVVFLTVDDHGDEFLIDQALSKTAYEGCVLLDGDAANREHFHLPAGVSRTVFVNRSGVVAGYSREAPEEDVVRAVLDGKTADDLLETSPQPITHQPEAGLDSVPSFEVHISPAPKTEFPALGRSEPNRYISKNEKLTTIIMELWDTWGAWVLFPEDLDQGRYDITAYMMLNDRNLVRERVREAMEQHFGLSIRKETRMQHVYILTATRKTSSQIRPSSDEEEFGESGSGDGTFFGEGQTMSTIATMLSGQLKVPVLDETGVKGEFDFFAHSELPQPEGAIDMAHQLGLELTPADRLIEMLVVRKVQ